MPVQHEITDQLRPLKIWADPLEATKEWRVRSCTTPCTPPERALRMVRAGARAAEC